MDLKIIVLCVLLLDCEFTNLTPAPPGRDMFDDDENLIAPKLLSDLLKNHKYDPKERPGAREGPTYITIQMYIRDISSVDEKSFEFTADLDIQLTWYESRLTLARYTETSPDSYMVVRGELLNKIWKPDLYFENTKGSEKKIQEELRLFPNGTVKYTQRIIIVLGCTLQLRKYPLDTQTCYIQLGSFAYDTRDVIYRWKPNDPNAVRMNDVLTLPTFTVDTPQAQNNCSGTVRINANQEYTCLQAMITMVRFAQFHLFQTYLPTILLVVASWISFWIDPNAVPARIALSVTTLLSIVSMASAVRIGLPTVSYLKAIDIWMFMCILFIFAALLEYSIMSHGMALQKQGKSWTGGCCDSCSRKKPKEEPEIVIQASGHDTASLESGTTITSRKNTKVKTLYSAPAPQPTPAKSPSIAYDIDKISRFLFPIAFVIFNIGYWTAYKVEL